MTQWFKPLAGHWLTDACELLTTAASVVRVSIVDSRGSAPREAGASLLVTGQCLLGSIGGGQLEWQALECARAMLGNPVEPAVKVQSYTLGPDLNQCCGGRVELWLERLEAADRPALERTQRLLSEQATARLVTHFAAGRITRHVTPSEPGGTPALRCLVRPDGSLTLIENWQPQLPPLWIFGAGHVGQAILRLLEDLPLFDVTCIDSRPGLVPDPGLGHLHGLQPESPVHCVAEAPGATRFLVMTHDHSLDYALCHSILTRSDFAWLGLIGSSSKGARFRSRLARDGLTRARIDRLCSPIGLETLRSKLPAAIALSVVAQLLEQLGAATQANLPVTRAIEAECTGTCADCDSMRRTAT